MAGTSGNVVWVALLALLMYGIFVLPRPTFETHKEGGILITGTSSGIGRHAAISLAKQGYTVFATVRKQADVDDLNSLNVENLRPIIMDVTKQEEIDAAVELIKESGVKLFGLVNNAGISARVPLEGHDMDRIRSMFEVNTFGLIAVTQAFLPTLRENKGRIVNIGSVAGLVGMPGSSIYSATKFGLEGLTDALRRELHPFGVSVSIVEPAFVKTAIAGKSTGEHSSIHWVDEGVKETYSSFFATFEEKRLKGERLASSVDVTTEAITDALLNKKPETRYVVATTYHVPAKVTHFLSWILPDRLEDMLLSAEHLFAGMKKSDSDDKDL
eukprot:m.38235 g.38235  ORF g.38235 m.38235 type:complete len:328 (-) comp10194_c0_seq1:209-1192(-)